MAVALCCLSCAAVAADADHGQPTVAAGDASSIIAPRVFENSRDPPTYRPLTGELLRRDALGHAVFNTQFVAAGMQGAERIDGLGPLFNGSSCDECHNEGADARGPVGDGPAPSSMVVQLEPPAADGVELTGDPRYGHVLSTSALEGLLPEGSVTIHYSLRAGHYADGSPWQLRAPSYQLSGLRYGPLAATTVIRPRLAPPLFGDGLLEAVPADAITQGPTLSGQPAWQWVSGRRVLGRFGWQGTSLSIRDQVAKALSREMGLTNSDIPYDDCTSVEVDCLAQPSGGHPELSDELVDALIQFVGGLAVPAAASPAGATTSAPIVEPTFVALGCAGCHRPLLPVVLSGAQGHPLHARIAAYTDLRLHDLGDGLADRDVGGRIVPSRWRTAPLWGLGYRLGREHLPTLLHDGRARNLEEAILWHGGEASRARDGFEQLPRNQREALLHWLATR